MGSSATDIFPAMVETMLEFRAGKMFFEGKKVVPDTRKGLIRIARGEEGLLHFQWLDRAQNVVEDGPDEVLGGKMEKVASMLVETMKLTA